VLPHRQFLIPGASPVLYTLSLPPQEEPLLCCAAVDTLTLLESPPDARARCLALLAPAHAAVVRIGAAAHLARLTAGLTDLEAARARESALGVFSEALASLHPENFAAITAAGNLEGWICEALVPLAMPRVHAPPLSRLAAATVAVLGSDGAALLQPSSCEGVLVVALVVN